jgi:large subunit ribosomal protein L15
MNLHEISQGITSRRKRKRIGRGMASGQGKTAGRGHKGAQSRSGYSRHPAFQGGAMPMVRRIPKRGFNNRFAASVFALNIGEVAAAFEAGTHVTPELLKSTGLVKVRCDEIKILGDGLVDKPLELTVTRISRQAKEKVEAAGGKVTVIAAKRTPAERVASQTAS